MILPTLVGPPYRTMARSADPSECVNWMVEPVSDSNAQAPAVLNPTPGFTAYETLSPGPIRATFLSHDNRLFVVSGFNFYEVLSAGGSTLHGTVALDSNPATMCSNGAAGGQVFITSGDKGYLFDLNTDTLSTVLASGAAQGAYLRNVFIALNTDLSLIRLSEIDDGSTWDPTQFAQRSLAADPWVSMKVVNSECWLLGDRTSEVWAYQGTFPFPFSPIPGAFFNVGCAAPFSAEIVSSVLVWVAQDSQGIGTIVRANGYAAERISTYPVEFAIQGYANLSDAQAFAYQELGHAFWVCNFVDGGRSWGWDLSTGLWHERGYWNTTTAAYEALRVGTHCQGFTGEHVVGDRVSGQLYTMSSLVSTDVDGSGIRRLRVFRGFDDEQKLIAVHRLQIEAQMGIGLSSGQGSDPQIMLQVSRDDGQTYGPERWRDLGKIGEFNVRAFWLRLGQARSAAYRAVVSDPVYPITLIRCTAEASRGLS